MENNYQKMSEFIKQSSSTVVTSIHSFAKEISDKVNKAFAAKNMKRDQNDQTIKKIQQQRQINLKYFDKKINQIHDDFYSEMENISEQAAREINKKTSEILHRMVDIYSFKTQMLKFQNSEKLFIYKQKNENENYVSSYEIPKKLISQKLKQQLKQLKDVINLIEVSALCQFQFYQTIDQTKNTIFVKVWQGTQYVNEQTDMDLQVLVKELTEGAVKMKKYYQERQSIFNPVLYFTKSGISVKNGRPKINLVEGLLKKYDPKMDLAQSSVQYFEDFLLGVINMSDILKKKYKSSPTFDNLFHFFMCLKKSEEIQGILQHPFLLSPAEKLLFIHRVNQYTQEVFDDKYLSTEPPLVLREIRNGFTDWIEYHAFIQNIDNRPPSDSTCYNWKKPRLSKLIDQVNSFRIDKLKLRRRLSKKKYGYHLWFVRNLLFHSSSYKDTCIKWFYTTDHKLLLEKLQKMFPRFLTFTYDYQKVARAYFQGINAQPRQYKLNSFIGRHLDTVEFPQDIITKDENVFNLFKDEILYHMQQPLQVSSKMCQLQSKSRFYQKCNKKCSNWLQPKEIQQLTQQSLTGKSRLKYYRFYIILQQCLNMYYCEIIDETQLKQSIMAYHNKCCPYVLYSCLNFVRSHNDQDDQ